MCQNYFQKVTCFEDLRKGLLTKERIYKKQNLFRTKQHDSHTIEQNKKALSFCDNKRCILNNAINNLAWVIIK